MAQDTLSLDSPTSLQDLEANFSPQELADLEKEFLSLGEDLSREFGEVDETPIPLPPLEEAAVSTVDPDSFLNQAAIGWDNVKGGVLEGLGLFADMIGLDEDAQTARELAEKYRLEAQARPQPKVSPSITKEAGKIVEGEVDSVIEHMLAMTESLTATALPSLIPSVGAYALAEKTAPLIRWIPYIGRPAAWAMKLAMTLLPGYLQGSGEIYRDAKKGGASEENAKLAAVTGGALIGILDRFAAGTIFKGAVRSLGKKKVIEGLTPKLGKKIAKEVVEEGLKQSSPAVLRKALKAAGATAAGTWAVAKETGKGVVKGAAAEGPTEGAQAIASMAASRLAADKPVGVDTAEFWSRVIDEGALGIFGGGSFRGATEGMGPLVRRQTINKAKELEEATDKLPEEVYDAEKELANMMNEGHTKTSKRKTGDPAKLDEVRKIGGRATTFLKNLAARTPTGAKFVNDLRNFFIDTNQEIGANYSQFQDIIRDAKKTFKIPLTRRIPKKVNDAIAKQLRYGERAADKRVAKIGDEIRAFLNEQHENLRKSGVDVRYVENYLTNTYKLPMTGQLGRRHLAKKKFKRILDKNNVRDSGAVLDNIISNNNVHLTEDDVDIFEPERPEGTLPTTKKAFEKPRQLDEHVVKQLDEAGLVENNVEALVNSYIVAASRRARIQEIKNRYKDSQKEMDFREGEKEYARNIFQGYQNRYKAFDKKGRRGRWARPVYQWSNTAGYITKLGLAGFTALSEPLIALSRIHPKHVIWGAVDASVVSAAKIARTFFPKMKPGKLERSMTNLMQTADLALVDSIRDIGDMAVAKKVTDKFFRAIMLAQVTQFSRFMAFGAAKRQIQEDIKILDQEGDVGHTRESEDARSRLKKQGLVNVVKGLQGRPDKNIEEIVDWAYSGVYDQLGVEHKTEKIRASDEHLLTRLNLRDWESFKKLSPLEKEQRIKGLTAMAEPPLITKAIGKTVDEIIMTPNVVNRPLWMSNPWLSPAAQLKGFMMVFGNTIAPKLWHEVGRPFFKGRLPVGEAAKWTMTLSLLMAAMYGTLLMKDTIRYGDEESPRDDMSNLELLAYLLQQSNIFGYGNILPEMIRGTRGGLPPYVPPFGPVPTELYRLVQDFGDIPEGDPRALASWVARNTPLIGMLSPEREIPGTDYTKADWQNFLEEQLEPVVETAKDVSDYLEDMGIIY